MPSVISKIYGGYKNGLDLSRDRYEKISSRRAENDRKWYNLKLARERVVVEHTIARTKKYGIMGTRFKNRLKRYDRASSIVSWLVNLRIMRVNGLSL